jgi:hypothetical protein
MSTHGVKLCTCKCVCEVNVTLHACIWIIQVMHSCQHMNYNTHIQHKCIHNECILNMCVHLLYMFCVPKCVWCYTMYIMCISIPNYIIQVILY